MTSDGSAIFEIGYRSFPWATMLRPLVFVAIALLLIWLSKGKRPFVVVGVFVASMAIIFFLIALAAVVPSFLKQRNAYASGKSLILEGVVEDFHPAPQIGPARESFILGGIPFSYNVLDVTPCFHDAPIHRGPLREGLHVLIHYNGACIQRIDVVKAGSLTTQP